MGGPVACKIASPDIAHKTEAGGVKLGVDPAEAGAAYDGIVASARAYDPKERIEGVLVARNYVMMDYDIPTDRFEAAAALAPGIESPTVSPLHRAGWVAVRAMVPRAGAQRLMDELFDLGARGILLTDIHACRL